MRTPRPKIKTSHGGFHTLSTMHVQAEPEIDSSYLCLGVWTIRFRLCHQVSQCSSVNSPWGVRDRYSLIFICEVKEVSRNYPMDGS
jgi:hypothetical protein